MPSGDSPPALEREFLIVVSAFHVTYTVRDCGYGMELLVGYYDNMDGAMVNIEQVCVPIHCTLCPLQSVCGVTCICIPLVGCQRYRTSDRNL